MQFKALLILILLGCTNCSGKERNGMFRLCANFSKRLSKTFELHQFSLPSLGNIFAILGSGTIFSHVDLSDACFQNKMDFETNLLAINTQMSPF